MQDILLLLLVISGSEEEITKHKEKKIRILIPLTS